MLTHPDGLHRLHTTRHTLPGRAPSLHLNDVTPVQVSFVFQEGDELPPRNVLLVAGVPVTLKHTLDVQVIHEHSVVLFDEPRRKFVLIVQHVPPNTALALRYLVGRSVLLARQLPLVSTESLVLVFEVEPVNGLAVARVDVVQDTEVNPDAIACVKRVNVWFLG